MILRRILASFLVFLLVVLSLPAYLVFALSKTYFNGSFYRDQFAKKFYDYVVDTSARRLYETDPVVKRYFKQTELASEIRQVFTLDLFQKIMTEVGANIEKLKIQPAQAVTLSLKTVRESLLTVTHNLAYKLFQSIPACKTDELPAVNREGIPTCIPQGVDYANVSAPLGKQFEKVIYEIVPEQVQIDLTKGQSTPTFYYLFSWLDQAKIYLFVGLLTLTALIAVILYKPLALMMFFEAVAFLSAGLIGFLASVGFQWLPAFVTSQPGTATEPGVFSFFGGKTSFQHFWDYIFGFLVAEIQKLALIFLILGVILLVIHFFLKKRTEA